MSKPTGKLIRLTAGNVGAVPVGRKVNNKPLSADISLSAGDVGAYSKTETDTKVADAKKAGTDAQTKANAANTAATNANNNANGRVPSARKVNGKPLTADITLSAGDVGTYTKQEIDTKTSAGSGLGYNQKWQDVTANRTFNTTYTNTMNKPIVVYIVGSTNSGHQLSFTLDGIVCNHFKFSSTGQNINLTIIVPQGSSYSFNGNGVNKSYFKWLELR